jgi:short-subunit dehydrogenase
LEKRAFITGISSGIGRELTRKLLASGWQVWGVARRENLLKELAEELSDPGFFYDCCDVTDIKAMALVHKKMLDNDFLPDVVILNAAVDIEDQSRGVDFDASVEMMRANVDGASYWISAFLESFLVRGTGQFVGISSILAHWPDANSVSYSASKAALSMIMRGLRIRYVGTSLQFKLLYLGPVDTSINPRFTEQENADSFVIASVSSVAAYIEKLIKSKRKNFYYPFYVGVVFATLRWLPDDIFEYLSSRFKR